MPPVKNSAYRTLEITGSSAKGIEDAINKALQCVHRDDKELCWFQVIETRGNVDNGKVHHWQVTIKVGVAIHN